MKFSGDIFIGGSKIKPLYDFTEASSLDIVTQKILGHIFIYPVFLVLGCACAGKQSLGQPLHPFFNALSSQASFATLGEGYGMLRKDSDPPSSI